jgi:TonB family protein
MFRRLAETSPRWVLLTTIEGYLFSIVAHVMLVGSVFIVGPPDAVSDEVPESFRWVEFLIPKDKPLASPKVGESVAYVAVAPQAGGEGLIPLDAAKEPDRLEVVLPEGTGKDEEEEVVAPPPPATEVSGDTIMTVLEVDTAAARYEDSAAPPYPSLMLQRKVEGSVAVQYVVDTTGLADTTSFVILSTTHAEFAKSVRSTLPDMRFRPAVMNARKVRQLVQQLFTFKIDSTNRPPDPKKKTEQ